jgi:hypothetical protein
MAPTDGECSPAREGIDRFLEWRISEPIQGQAWAEIKSLKRFDRIGQPSTSVSTGLAAGTPAQGAAGDTGNLSGWLGCQNRLPRGEHVSLPEYVGSLGLIDQRPL